MMGMHGDSARRGFSLLEVLIAIAIFSTGLLSVSIMLISTIRGNAASIHLTTATRLAERQIEEIMLMDYDGITDMDGDGSAGLDDMEAKADARTLSRSMGKPFAISWNVAEDWPANDTKTIRVIVSWHDGLRDTKTSFDMIRTRGD